MLIFISDGNVLVVDSNNGRIVHWDKERQLCSEIYSYNANKRRIGSIIEVSKKMLRVSSEEMCEIGVLVRYIR